MNITTAIQNALDDVFGHLPAKLGEPLIKEVHDMADVFSLTEEEILEHIQLKRKDVPALYSDAPAEDYVEPKDRVNHSADVIADIEKLRGDDGEEGETDELDDMFKGLLGDDK